MAEIPLNLLVRELKDMRVSAKIRAGTFELY